MGKAAEEAKGRRKPKTAEVPLGASKQTLVVETRCGERIKLHYRQYRRKGRVCRVLAGPFVVDGMG